MPLTLPSTRTLSILASNIGNGDAVSVRVRFYDGEPQHDGSTSVVSGTLIGAATLDSLAAGEGKIASIEWDINGQGGQHTIFAIIDTVAGASQDTEFNYQNNNAQSDITLPRLTSGLSMAPASITSGQSTIFTITLQNLQSAASLPVTATLRVRSPRGVQVYEHIWPIALNGGETRNFIETWQSDTSAASGDYAVTLVAQHADGEPQNDYATFNITVQKSVYHHIYLPLVVRN